MEKALGSFLALVGFIIMLGRGLGEILNETRVSHTLVYKIVYGVGINTQRRVKIGVVLSSLAIVGVLGTLAGGLAILAPILRPIASKVGITRPSLGVLLQAAGEEALILGPFAPPVVALLGVVNISYFHMLVYASIPIAFVTLGTSWIMANKLQNKYKEELFDYKDEEAVFKPSRLDNIVTTVFILVFLACVVYGLVFKAKTSFVVFVMLLLALVTGLTGKLSLKRIFELLLHGMSKNLHLFFIFILLDPFLNLVQSAGGFDALTKLFMPLEHVGGKAVVAILTGLTGAFGMPAASAAVIKMLSEMFSPAAIQMQLPH